MERPCKVQPKQDKRCEFRKKTSPCWVSELTYNRKHEMAAKCNPNLRETKEKIEKKSSSFHGFGYDFQDLISLKWSQSSRDTFTNPFPLDFNSHFTPALPRFHKYLTCNASLLWKTRLFLLLFCYSIQKALYLQKKPERICGLIISRELIRIMSTSILLRRVILHIIPSEQAHRKGVRQDYLWLKGCNWESAGLPGLARTEAPPTKEVTGRHETSCNITKWKSPLIQAYRHALKSKTPLIQA